MHHPLIHARRAGAALVTGVALLLVAAPARADVAIDCETMNAENIALGLADTNGFTLDGTTASNSSSYGGVHRYININNQTIQLPPNGIVCVAHVTCATSDRTLRFARNDANTPVYLLVEYQVNLAHDDCRIDVSGGPAITLPGGMGLTVRGGIGGPGGSDGGSCDGVTSGQRAGAGVGPGGGGGAENAGGGGGASPVEDGGESYENQGNGGGAYSTAANRMLHGGSGGGCGYDPAASVASGGGGGGGVLVVAASDYIAMNGVRSGFWARGGGSTDNYNRFGGWGGGGVVRLIADEIRGDDGFIDVRADTVQTSYSSATTYCDSASYPGGCGGAGVYFIEGALSGTPSFRQFLDNSRPLTSQGTGTQGDPVPDAGTLPTLEITSVKTSWPGAGETLAPKSVVGAGSDHVHATVGVYVDAPTPAQTIEVWLTSNNIPDTAVVNVKINALGTPAQVATATKQTGSGSGALTWMATLTVPAGADLGTLEAWVSNVCTPGAPGCAP